jgi:hypothetical protein
MCADTDRKQSPQTPESKVAVGAEKVRSSRYEWEHETAAAERREKPRQLMKCSPLLAAIARFFRTLVGSGTRSPFDSDDDPDPMAA